MALSPGIDILSQKGYCLYVVVVQAIPPLIVIGDGIRLGFTLYYILYIIQYTLIDSASISQGCL